MLLKLEARLCQHAPGRGGTVSRTPVKSIVFALTFCNFLYTVLEGSPACGKGVVGCVLSPILRLSNRPCRCSSSACRRWEHCPLFFMLPVILRRRSTAGLAPRPQWRGTVRVPQDQSSSWPGARQRARPRGPRRRGRWTGTHPHGPARQRTYCTSRRASMPVPPL